MTSKSVARTTRSRPSGALRMAFRLPTYLYRFRCTDHIPVAWPPARRHGARSQEVRGVRAHGRVLSGRRSSVVSRIIEKLSVALS